MKGSINDVAVAPINGATYSTVTLLMKKLAKMYYNALVLGLKFDVELGQERMKVCEPCPLRMGILCGECKCLLAAKTKRVVSSCPKKKW